MDNNAVEMQQKLVTLLDNNYDLEAKLTIAEKALKLIASICQKNEPVCEIVAQTLKKIK